MSGGNIWIAATFSGGRLGITNVTCDGIVVFSPSP